jgi:hypothetical protein
MRTFVSALALGLTAVAGPAQAAYKDYVFQAKGPWTVYGVLDNGKYWQCAAEIRSGKSRMRLIKFEPTDQLIIATPTTRTKQFDGRVAFNGAGNTVKWATFNGWAAWSSNDTAIYKALPKGRKLSLDNGSGYVDYSLGGVEGVLSALRTCAAKKGLDLKFDFSSAKPKPTHCAAEGQMCRFVGTKTVIYGIPGRTISKVAKNEILCSNAAMGKDPAPNVKKSCSIQ